MCVLGVKMYVYGYISVHFPMAFDLLKMLTIIHIQLYYTKTFITVFFHYFQFLICSQKCLRNIFLKMFLFSFRASLCHLNFEISETDCVFRSVVQFLLLFIHWIILEVTDVLFCFVFDFIFKASMHSSPFFNFVRKCLWNSNQFDLIWFDFCFWFCFISVLPALSMRPHRFLLRRLCWILFQFF